MAAGLTITKIVIIESLESHERKTGQILAGHLEAEVARLSLHIEIDFRTCWSAIEFRRILELLRDEAEDGHVPVIHVECHGDRDDGLEFENGSNLPWEELAAALVPINVVTGFNLLVSVSACFGGYFVGMMGAIKPSPVYAVVAPTDTVRPSELLAGFLIFYTTFLETLDAGKAERKLTQQRLSSGRWFSQVAELWFERVVLGYARTYCSKKATRKRAGKLYRKLKKGGRASHVGNLKRQLKKRNRESLLKDYFSQYFMVEKIPPNAVRFSPTRARMQRALEDLRGTGKYVL